MTRTTFTIDFNGYSMYPFLKPGDRLIVHRASPESFQIGDIVLVPDPAKRYIAHRLVRMIPPDKCILKGDSLLKPDPGPTELTALSGKVVAIFRKDQLIPLSTGLRSMLKKVYVFLSLNGLTSGAIRLRARNILLRLFPSDNSKEDFKEWRFIIETLCNRTDQTVPDPDWIRIMSIASEEGVIGILYKTLKDEGIPQSALDLFRDYYLSIAALNIININALKEIKEALCNEQIEVMSLKGASLLNSIYPDIGMRPMGDIDLMVRPEEQDRFVHVLYRLGYKENMLLPHIFYKDKVIVDIHTHAMDTDRVPSYRGLFPAGMEPIWDNSVPWREGHQWLRRPDDMDNILLNCQHMMKHSFSKLIWLVDILRLIRNNDTAFWENLFKRAAYLGQEKSLSYTLYLLDRIFSFRPVVEMGYGSTPPKPSRLERAILEARANGQSIEFIGPVMAISCVEGFRNRVTLGWESLFPNDEIVKQEIIGVSTGKRFFYYPLRFWRIAAPIFKQSFMILGYVIRVGKIENRWGKILLPG